MTISGTDLDDVSELLFSHLGIKAEVQPVLTPDGKPLPGVSRRFKVMVAGDVPRRVL
ncbi:MAG: hypothetical protein QM811_28935 [Pirellulales bacterium]